MPVKIQKKENELTVEQLLNQSHELDTNTVHAIYALKPVALNRLHQMLESKDSRTVLQAARLILEFGHS
jgi:hypothetical protein